MEIILGKYNGFCNGVKNTVDKAIESINKYKKVYCLGEIVHNENVIDNLKNMGIIFVNNIEDVPDNENLIIRAHGERKEIYNICKNRNINIIDLTCGKIMSIRKKIDKYKDYFIIIVGKKNHPEVIGNYSYIKNGIIVEDISDIDIEYINKYKDIYILSQTTMSLSKYNDIVNYIKNNIDSNIVSDMTICFSTENRQKEVEDIAKKTSIMYIVGGKNSSNTKELYLIAKKYLDKVYLIQDKSDIEYSLINKDDIIGIVSGASTDIKIIDDIYNDIKRHYF